MSDYKFLFNLQRAGLIKDDNSMAEFITNDKQFKFILRRERTTLWITDTSYKFKCFIDIYDNLTDTLYLTLNCSEEDIKMMLDCWTEASNYGLQNITVPSLKPFSANGNFFLINLELYRIDQMNLMSDISNRWFNVKEYNPMEGLLIDRISIQMDLFEMEELMDLCYFIFLIDLEPTNYQIAIRKELDMEYD